MMMTRRSARKIATPEPQKPAEDTNRSKRGEKKKANPKVAPAPLKKIKFSRITFDSTQTDPVIEYLKKFPDNKTLTRSSYNISAEILDQIALEGLSGIKLGRLFHMLDALIPNLNCTQDENCQQYVWSIIVNRYIPSKAVQAFYIDPKAKKEEESYNPPNKGVIIEKKIQLPINTDKRHPKIDSLLHPVQDGFIMGSCAQYLSRIDISHELQHGSGNEGILTSMYDTNQKYGFENIYFVANQIIRSKAILPDWADPNVDIKLREYCALELIGRSRTMGTTFPNDKALGRYRIMLVAKGFITQYQQSCTSPVEHHLLRFSSDQVIASNKAAAAVANSRNDSSDDEDDNNKSLSSVCCDPTGLKSDRSILSMVYDIIAESRGLTKLDMRKKLKLPKFHLRNHLKNLLSLRMICSHRPKDSDSQYRIYKTAHKSNKRKKVKEEESVKPTGVMSTWDEIDLRAKKMIGHKRSSFSQAEDSLLILCRISSILIDPSSRVSWCVHKRLIRDLLHGELVEAHDKTSDACLRRIKYLKKLPNNIMSINELTAELRDDPDIRKLTARFEKPVESNDKLNKLFVQVLKTVRIKIPNLLGITTTESSPVTCANGSTTTKTITSVGTSSNLRRASSMFSSGSASSGRSAIIGSGHSKSEMSKERSIEINDHEELKEKYELVDCQSVASILRAPTYEQAKNVVDVKFNNASLVTMAFILTSCLSSGMVNNLLQTNSRVETELKMEEGEEEEAQQRQQVSNKRRAHQWLLEKFYSGYHDKLISSVLSKLNKRSLLTRKCPAEQASMYKPKTKMSLKLNQSVIFLLTRHHASSLMQLAHPINELYKIDLSESNEMASIALLTSLCSMRSFNLDLTLKVPEKIVEIDQNGEDFDSLIVQPCKIDFFSEEPMKLNEEALDTFLQEQNKQEQPLTCWLVKSFSLPQDKVLTSNKEFETNKIQVEYSARLWKQIDGSVHMLTLFKLIESLLSWIIVYPGIERDLLDREFGHLMPSEHLFELLELMDNLKLITRNELKQRDEKPRLFGFTKGESNSRGSFTYEARANAFINYCQLLNRCTT